MILMKKWFVPALTVLLLVGPALAQDKLPPAKYRQQEIEDLRQKVKEMEAQITKLQAQLDARKKAANELAAKHLVKSIPAVLPQAIIRLNGQVLRFAKPTPPNPIMKGEYRTALDSLGGVRKKLDQIEEPTKARKVLDEMSRTLLDVRRALWKIEQKQKKQKEQAPPTEAKPQLPAAGAGFHMVRRIVIGNQQIRFRVEAPPNPLLTGEYKQALDKFAEARKKLDRTDDPVLARKVVDDMDRLLLDARRALWECEKAKKKAKKKAAQKK